MKSNPYPVSSETAERQGGGNVPASGEKHDQSKGKTVPADKRFAGAENTLLANSPGRVSEDVSKKE